MKSYYIIVNYYSMAKDDGDVNFTVNLRIKLFRSRAFWGSEGISTCL